MAIRHSSGWSTLISISFFIEFPFRLLLLSELPFLLPVPARFAQRLLPFRLRIQRQAPQGSHPAEQCLVASPINRSPERSQPGAGRSGRAAGQFSVDAAAAVRSSNVRSLAKGPGVAGAPVPATARWVPDSEPCEHERRPSRGYAPPKV